MDSKKKRKSSRSKREAFKSAGGIAQSAEINLVRNHPFQEDLPPLEFSPTKPRQKRKVLVTKEVKREAER